MKTEHIIIEDATDLYQNAPFGYLTYRADGLIVNINNTLLQWLSFDRNEILYKKSFQDLLGMGEKIYFETHITPILQLESEIAEINIELKGKEGKGFPALVNAKKIKNIHDNEIYVRLSVLNITQRKQYELELMKAKKEAEYGVKQLEQIKEELEKFAYIVSHDLKAPLRSIRELLKILNKKWSNMDDEKKEHYFNIIMNASEDMTKLIDNLLEYSRTTKVQEQIELVDIKEIMNKVQLYFEPEFLKLEGRLEIDCKLIFLKLYPIMFQRLLTNLISNAIKYRSSQPPIVQVSCREEQDSYVFSVEDNGMGIPENQFETIFQLFKSLNPNSDSNGIGLSVCKKIIDIHGGKIWVTSTIGQGSCFYFTIPKKTSE